MSSPVVTAGMLIRRPVAEVFNAFVDPAVTSRFWFTRSSGPLKVGAKVRWDWGMYGASDEVRVLALEPDVRILIEWDTPPSQVDWRFEARGDHTWLTVENRGFADDAEGVGKALNSSGGFALVLAAAKAWLEQGLDLRLIEDRFPDGVKSNWTGREEMDR